MIRLLSVSPSHKTVQLAVACTASSMHSTLPSSGHAYVQDFSDALARQDRAEEEARKARAKLTGRLEFQPAATARGAAVATAAAIGASLSRPPSAPLAAARTAAGVAAATIAVNAAKVADSKQRERQRWDSKASRR